MEEERQLTDADLEHIFQAMADEVDGADGQIIALKTITGYLVLVLAVQFPTLAKRLLQFLENPSWPEEEGPSSPTLAARKKGFERAAQQAIESLRLGLSKTS